MLLQNKLAFATQRVLAGMIKGLKKNLKWIIITVNVIHNA